LLIGLLGNQEKSNPAPVLNSGEYEDLVPSFFPTETHYIFFNSEWQSSLRTAASRFGFRSMGIMPLPYFLSLNMRLPVFFYENQLLTGKYFFISCNRQHKLFGLKKDLIGIENNCRKN